MRAEEAIWINGIIDARDTAELSPCINIGSGYSRPQFADEHVFAPLARKNVRVLHFDLNEGYGVDISGNIFDPACQEELKRIRPKLIICSNMLEHLPLEGLERIPSVFWSILVVDGILIVTVPNSFPYHADPIDTLYRPSPEDLANLFERFEILSVGLVSSDRYLDDLKKTGPKGVLKNLLFRLAKPFRRRHRLLNAAHSLFWLFRPYRHSCVALRKRVS